MQKARAEACATTHRLFHHLHRGGQYAHLWTDAGNQSHWFLAGNLSRQTQRMLYRQWVRHNVFFTVHPLTRVPPTNASGNPNPRYISSQLPFISAINTLFAEYDAKDYVRLPEYLKFLPPNFTHLSDLEQRKAIRSAQEDTFYASPERYKDRVLKRINELYPAPSVIVDSGGGYHCYWLLKNTVPIDDSNRTDVQSIQHGWVRMLGADPGASDLRRVLRVPGTYNRKPGFGSNPRLVSYVRADFDNLYDYVELEERVNDWSYENEPQQLRRRSFLVAQNENRSETEESIRAAFNRQHSVIDLLVEHGYQISFSTDKMTRMARPGREKKSSSVIVFPGQEGAAPELSIHFSTNDELYSEEYIHPRTNQIKRRAYDAYSIYTHLVHGGNRRRAFAAARQELEP